MSGSAHASDLFVAAEGGGSLARLDPRVRLGVCLGFLLALPALHDFPVLVLAVLVGAALALAARTGWHRTLRRLAMAEGFLIALLVSLPFIKPGQPVFEIAGFAASREGFWQAFVLILRINAAVLASFALLGGLGSAGLAQAMIGLGAPTKLAQILQMAVRYVALFDEEYHRLRRAMRARGFRPGSNLHSWRSYGQLIGMLVLRSFERAERVRWAMACRGYSGRFLLAEARPLTAGDMVFAGLGAAVVGGLLALDVLR